MDKTSINKLHQLNGFIPFVIVVFINAFVDLGHKIIIQNTVFKVYDGEIQVMLTALVNGLILLPFVLLFSPAGFISDRFRKPMVMRVSAAVAVLLTLFITLAYYRGWFVFAFAMTFLLAVQSAFYSPAKYGYIKELGGAANLAPMNAVVQAVTMIAILLGVFLFSVLFENSLQGITYRNESELLSSIAPIGWVLVACSIIELILTFKLPIATAESTGEQTSIPRFQFSGYVSGHYLKHNLHLLLSNRNVWLSIIGLSMFWGISQVILAAFPALAKEVLAETNTIVIQGILACSGFGLVIGSTLAGRASRQYIETGFVAVGAIGIVACLFILTRLDSSLAFALVILTLGFFGGMFVVPLNAIIQFQADSNKLGTVLAGNNWVQNIVMLTFLCLTMAVVSLGINTLGLFYAIAFIALVGALYTIYQLPQTLIRLVISKLFASRYRIRVQGFDNLPSQGAVLMLGNHISWLDWAMIQIACPRPLHFVMHRAIYERWYLKWFLDFFGVIPIAGGSSRQSLEEINALLKAGEVVCLFPEGAISRNGQLGEFKHGFEKTVEAVDGIILPFYLRGLWGSRFSRASERMKILRSAGLRRDIIVAFGRPLSIDSKAAEVKNRVFDLSIDAWETYTRTLDSCHWPGSAQSRARVKIFA